MAIPNYQNFMLPLLRLLQNGQKKRFKEIVEKLKNEAGLSQEEKNEMLPSGQMKIADNRIGWARFYLKKAGLITDPERGFSQITEKGKEVLKSSINSIDVKFLSQFQEFNDFKFGSSTKQVVNKIDEKKDKTPDEMIEEGYAEKHNELATNILEKLRSNSPVFFEKVVLDLLERMGYGQGKVTGKSGDGGVDGIIHQDALGLEKILFQAKRFADGNSVAASMVRDFVGTLEVNGVSKGVFITTSKFPKNAEDVISKTQKRIVLIDGPKLVDYMINYDLGVTTLKTYTIKSPDLDYFLED